MRGANLKIGALLLLTACASAPTPIRLTADPEGRALLVGKWSGFYYTEDGNRTGSIELWFDNHDTTGVECRGDVVMVPRNQMPAPDYDKGGISAPDDAIRVLEISSLIVTGGDVQGAITPYTDPETGETLNTWFEGRIVGDKITGTLITIHGRSGVETTGTWEAFRGK
jgi:hypothetical protein